MDNRRRPNCLRLLSALHKKGRRGPQDVSSNGRRTLLGFAAKEKSHTVTIDTSSGEPLAQLKREVGVLGATMLGLGSIVGTGVFVSIGIAAGIAGPKTPADQSQSRQGNRVSLL